MPNGEQSLCKPGFIHHGLQGNRCEGAESPCGHQELTGYKNSSRGPTWLPATEVQNGFSSCWTLSESFTAQRPKLAPPFSSSLLTRVDNRVPHLELAGNQSVWCMFSHWTVTTALWSECCYPLFTEKLYLLLQDTQGPGDRNKPGSVWLEDLITLGPVGSRTIPGPLRACSGPGCSLDHEMGGFPPWSATGADSAWATLFHVALVPVRKAPSKVKCAERRQDRKPCQGYLFVFVEPIFINFANLCISLCFITAICFFKYVLLWAK